MSSRKIIKKVIFSPSTESKKKTMGNNRTDLIELFKELFLSYSNKKKTDDYKEFLMVGYHSFEKIFRQYIFKKEVMTTYRTKHNKIASRKCEIGLTTAFTGENLKAIKEKISDVIIQEYGTMKSELLQSVPRKNSVKKENKEEKEEEMLY